MTRKKTTSAAAEATGVRFRTEIARSPYGTAFPTLTLEAPKEMHWRKVAASLHRIAAATLEATPREERWCVVVDVYGDSAGRVYLELMTGEQDEAERGLAVLEAVAKARV